LPTSKWSLARDRIIKMTQPQIVEKFLLDLNGQWIERNELSNKNCEYGFMPPRVERTIRQMLEKNRKEGKEIYHIEQKWEMKNGKNIAWVRATTPISWKVYEVQGRVVSRVPVY